MIEFPYFGIIIIYLDLAVYTEVVISVIMPLTCLSVDKTDLLSHKGNHILGPLHWNNCTHCARQMDFSNKDKKKKKKNDN